MAIEWAAIAAKVGPYLTKYAADRVGKLADGGLAGIYRRVCALNHKVALREA